MHSIQLLVQLNKLLISVLLMELDFNLHLQRDRGSSTQMNGALLALAMVTVYSVALIQVAILLEELLQQEVM
jgi:hypothetical protein